MASRLRRRDSQHRAVNSAETRVGLPFLPVIYSGRPTRGPNVIRFRSAPDPARLRPELARR